MQTVLENSTSLDPTINEHMFAEWRGVSLERVVFEDDEDEKIEVIAGTNAPSDTEHGTQTVVILHDMGGTVIQMARVIVDGEPNGQRGLMLVVGNDSGARMLVDALEFAAQTIKRQIKEGRE